jgi:hypothetical protein
VVWNVFIEPHLTVSAWIYDKFDESYREETPTYYIPVDTIDKVIETAYKKAMLETRFEYTTPDWRDWTKTKAQIIGPTTHTKASLRKFLLKRKAEEIDTAFAECENTRLLKKARKEVITITID